VRIDPLFQAHPPARAAGARVTFEPGGQLELSSPADLPSAACQAVAEDLAHLRRHLSDYGITLAGMGRDPLRPERRVLQSPRYVAMEQYFDALGSLGRVMMCGTASVQANLDLEEIRPLADLEAIRAPVLTDADTSRAGDHHDPHRYPAGRSGGGKGSEEQYRYERKQFRHARNLRDNFHIFLF